MIFNTLWRLGYFFGILQGMLSIIIPSYKEVFLQKTIDSLFENAEGDIEIIAILDGYWPNPPLENDPRIKIIHYTNRRGLRNAVNMGVAISKGEYLMKIDAHCMFDKGFDTKLLSEIENNWVVIPRRYKLNTEKWEICADDPEPIDYEKLIIEPKVRIYGQQWPNRARQRKDFLIDDNMLFQGSCWVMSRKHFNWLGGLQEEGYGTFVLEPLEIALKTWLGGGRVVVNKKTWYAHQHRRFGRTHQVHEEDFNSSNAYALDFWLNNKWKDRIHDIDWLINKFQIGKKPNEHS